MATYVSWIYEGQLQLTLHLTWFRDGNFLVTVNLNSLVLLLHIYLIKIPFQTESWTPLPVWPWGSFPPLWSGPTMSLLVNLVNLLYIELKLIMFYFWTIFRILQPEDPAEVVQRWQRPEGSPEGRLEGRPYIQHLRRPHLRRGRRLGQHRLQLGLPPEIDYYLVNLSPMLEALRLYFTDII